MPSDAPSPLERAVGQQRLARYNAALDTLSPEEREAIVACFELGLTHAGLAAAFRKPSPDAARKACAKAIAHRALDRAIERVADGSPVDWDALAREAADETERRSLEELSSSDACSRCRANATPAPPLSNAHCGTPSTTPCQPPHPPSRGRRLVLAAAATTAIIAAAAWTAASWGPLIAASCIRHFGEESCIAVTSILHSSDAVDAVAAYGLHPDQYAVFSGHEDLAFARRADDPAGSAVALRSALALMRPRRPGLQGAIALMDVRLAESGRRARDADNARADFMDAEAHAVSVLSDEDPLATILTMQAARRSQEAGLYDQAARDLRRALTARWRGLGLAELGQVSAPSHPVPDDSDGDGLLDCVEVVHGLDPATGTLSLNTAMKDPSP